MIGVDDPDEKPDEKSVLGFTTILNISHYQETKVMGELMSYVIEKSKIHNPHHEEFFKILQENADKIGIVINERVLNLSPQLIPTLHSQLCEDIKWVLQEHQQNAQIYDFKYLLFLSKCYKEVKRSIKKKQLEYDDYIYQKFEDFAFLQKAPMKFLFEAHSSKSMAGLTNVETEPEDQQCLRLIYMMTFEDYYNAVQGLGDYLEKN